MSVRFFPSYTSNPAPRRSLAPAARVGTRFLEPWAWADLEGRVQSYYWAHREAPPGLLPGRWGPGSPVPRPPPNPLARSSCSLWAWALCFPGFWSPPPFPDEKGARALDAVGRGLGCGSLVLRHCIHFRAPGRPWALDPSLGREKRLKSSQEGKGAQGIWHRHCA